MHRSRNVRYMSQVTWIFPQACRVGNPQMATRQVVNFCARSADRSHGIRGKRNIPRGSWHHLHVSCYSSLVVASYRSWDSKSWAKYRFCIYVQRRHVFDFALNTFQTTRVGSKALGSVAHRSSFAEACLTLSLPSVCAEGKNRISYVRDYVARSACSPSCGRPLRL